MLKFLNSGQGLSTKNTVDLTLFKKQKMAPFTLLCNTVLLKFMFSKKATKIEEIFTIDLTLSSECQIDGEDFVIFCGLLRKHKLYLKCKWLTSPATSVSDGSSELEESGLEFFL